MNGLLIPVAAVVGYLIGAISFGYLVARAHGVDILKEGSGNPGATNVKRVVGKGAGNLVFGLDAVKGIVATGWPLWFFVESGSAELAAIAGLIGALLGHSFSIFLRGKGGKGVATTIGGLAVLLPAPLFIGLMIWVMVFYASRYVSLASIIFAITLPISAFFEHVSMPLQLLTIGLALLIVYRHRSNIKRLIAGTENRFDRKD